MKIYRFMDIQENKKEETKCACAWCSCKEWASCGSWGKHWFLRLIIKLLVLAFVFGVGVKIGEFKADFRNEFYGGHMRGGYYMMRGGTPNGWGGMMQGGVPYGGNGMMRWGVPTSSTLPQQ